MVIHPISNISFTSKNSSQSLKDGNTRKSSPVTKVLPVVIAMVPAGGLVSSCVVDNRDVEGVGWLDVAFNRLTDEQIKQINETRQAPKNTVFQKVNETIDEEVTDAFGDTYIRKVETGRWHYELVNNASGTETGTTTLPKGYIVTKDILGFIEIVEEGTKSIFLQNNKKTAENIKKRDTVKNSINFLETASGLLSDEQLAKINKSRLVPKGTLIVKNVDGSYELTNDRLGLERGTRMLPEGYEMRKDLLGFAKIVPIDQKSIFLRKKENPDTIKNDVNIKFFEALSGLLNDEQIDTINKTRKMPEGTIIAKDESGNFYITTDALNIETGTRTLPDGYEVKKNRFGFAVVVPVDTKGIFIE